jgi:hypothetical protein
MSSEKRICSECVGDEYLKEIIDREGETAACEFCPGNKLTISLAELASRLDAVFEQFYQCTSAGEDCYTLSGSSLLEVLEEDLEFPEHVLVPLAEVMGELWYVHDANEHIMGEDPHFVAKEKLDSPLSEDWRRMEESLKYQARLNNPKVLALLERVFGPVIDDRVEGMDSVIVDLKPGEKQSGFYRARAYETLDKLEHDLASPEANLGPVPEGKGGAGRMNAQGISVFYGSMDPSVAIAEIRPPVGSHVVFGRFDVHRPLRLLDLQALMLVDVRDGSMFDPSIYNERMRRDFLKTLVRKLTRPVMPELVNQDYLITQAVADFLATHERLKLDGVIFRSTQIDPSEQPGVDARNVVLFHKASGVVQPNEGDGPFAVQTTNFHLMDYDEDRSFIAPNLITQLKKPKTRVFDFPRWDDADEVVPALTLDRDSLVISRIKGVKVFREDYPVEHDLRQP